MFPVGFCILHDVGQVFDTILDFARRAFFDAISVFRKVEAQYLIVVCQRIFATISIGISALFDIFPWIAIMTFSALFPHRMAGILFIVRTVFS